MTEVKRNMATIDRQQIIAVWCNCSEKEILLQTNNKTEEKR